MIISPLVAFSNPFRQRISVLLPEPLGPINARTSLLCTTKSTSFRTCLSPKYLFNLMALIITSSSTTLIFCGTFPNWGQQGYHFLIFVLSPSNAPLRIALRNLAGKLTKEMQSQIMQLVYSSIWYMSSIRIDGSPYSILYDSMAHNFTDCSRIHKKYYTGDYIATYKRMFQFVNFQAL